MSEPDDVERRHRENQDRLIALELRVTTVEVQMGTAIGILKYLGGAGVVLLALQWLSTIMR